jgi:hypothetical protein
MKLFTCPSCDQVLYFENTRCENCGKQVAYLSGEFVTVDPDAESPVQLCRNYVEHDACNWAVTDEKGGGFCDSCVLNDVIPNLESAESRYAWVRLETAKRRLLYSLSALGLPIERRSDAGGLVFAFKASTTEEPVFTGHSDGLITINIAEASDPFREKTREEMGEPYRTVLGHFRHEIGHYYWDRLVKGSQRLEPFKALFGDHTLDYPEAQRRHYEQGPPADWTTRFVSVYASMHPWEDWAETFAHYLHMVDTLETARGYGLAIAPRVVSGAPIPSVATRRLQFDDFDDLISAWFPLTNALNSLNRSMGLPDLYPFVLSDSAIAKLRFVHDVVAALPERAADQAESASCTLA